MNWSSFSLSVDSLSLGSLRPRWYDSLQLQTAASSLTHSLSSHSRNCDTLPTLNSHNYTLATQVTPLDSHTPYTLTDLLHQTQARAMQT